MSFIDQAIKAQRNHVANYVAEPAWIRPVGHQLFSSGFFTQMERKKISLLKHRKVDMNAVPTQDAAVKKTNFLRFQMFPNVHMLGI